MLVSDGELDLWLDLDSKWLDQVLESLAHTEMCSNSFCPLDDYRLYGTVNNFTDRICFVPFQYWISTADITLLCVSNFKKLLVLDKMTLAKFFDLGQFADYVERVSLPPKNQSQYLTYDDCSKTCSFLDSELLKKRHLKSMPLVQKSP